MNMISVLRWSTLAAMFPGLGMAVKVEILRDFGHLGQTIEDARKTGFFTWFHLEETARERRDDGEVVRFQPSGPKFHDLAMVSLETGEGTIRAATLRLSRSFIDGPEQAFARDIASSFLSATLFDDDMPLARDLTLQIARDYRGSRPLIYRAGTDRSVPQPFTAVYRVFLGQSVEASQSLAHMDLHLMNTRSGGDHLSIRVELARPLRRASSCNSK